MKQISNELYESLLRVRIITSEDDTTRNHNIGTSNYSKHIIQPWSIWLDYNLDPWDADIVKRVLRTKNGEPRKQDYEKIIHICKEKIAQLEYSEKSLNKLHSEIEKSIYTKEEK